MIQWIYILAQRRGDDGDDAIGKIIFGVLFFLFLGISALTSWMNKKKDEERKRKVREAIGRGDQSQRLEEMSPRGERQATTRVQREREKDRTESRDERIRRLQQMAGSRSAPPPPPPPIPRAIKPAPPKRPAPVSRRSVPPPPRLVTAAEPEEVRKPAEPQATPSVARPAPAAAQAQQIARWLKPSTLRSQFILTELLQPPLAMREPRDI